MIIRLYRTCKYLAVVLIVSSGCTLITGKTIMAEQNKKVLKTGVESYRLGRFSVEVPKVIKQAAVKYVVYYAEFDEMPWQNKKNHLHERKKNWDARLEKIKKITPPTGIKEVIIEEKDFSFDGRWSKGIAYRGNSMLEEVITWNVLIDTDLLAVWFQIEGIDDTRDKLIDAINDIVRSYRTPVNILANKVSIKSHPSFYLQYGAVDLPYKYGEEIYTRFEGHPLDQYLKLEIESNVVSKVEETNLIERLSASLASNFAPGLSIDQIRTESRVVAYLKGDEVVIRGTDDGNSKLSFSWRFPGEKKSAIAPEILITMETQDGDLDEKLELWDSILDSFKPLGH